VTDYEGGDNGMKKVVILSMLAAVLFVAVAMAVPTSVSNTLLMDGAAREHPVPPLQLVHQYYDSSLGWVTSDDMGSGQCHFGEFWVDESQSYSFRTINPDPSHTYNAFITITVAMDGIHKEDLTLTWNTYTVGGAGADYVWTEADGVLLFADTTHVFTIPPGEIIPHTMHMTWHSPSSFYMELYWT
jgi:hypothetical protein